MSDFRWGIFGTGTISAKFVAGLRAARGMRADFVASRSLETARRFASALGVGRAIEGYEEASRLGGVDAVYIATPASEHLHHALLCLEAGIPVLIEKPMATTARDAELIAATARKASVFAMEAMWTRFIPAAQRLRDYVASGKLGPVRLVSGNFGTSKVPSANSSSFSTQRRGGSLLHLGVYPVSLGNWLFGDADVVGASGTLYESGVDESASFVLRYANDVIGNYSSTIRAWGPNHFHVMGEHGLASFEGSIVRPHGLCIARQPPMKETRGNPSWKTRVRESGVAHRVAQLTGLSSRTRQRSETVPYQGNGYHYQAEEVRACIRAGRAESMTMPLAASIAVIRTLNEIDGIVRRPCGEGAN